MNAGHVDKIQEKIRRKAFRRYDVRRHAEEQERASAYTLDALQELTGLPRVELEAIAEEARGDFFSVKHQAMTVSGIFAVFFFIIGAVGYWFF